MSTNPLHDLQELGQSVWLDSIRRSYLADDGYLARLISAGEIDGLTSNPTIFERAVGSEDSYRAQLADLAGADPRYALWEVMIADVRAACDRFLGLYRESAGRRGFVSIECDPRHAYDTEATVAEARLLAERVARPNVMLKVPGTEAGLPAITRLITEGVHVNVTLLFSVERYEAVIAAHQAGLRARAERHEPLDAVASVASFFVSRVDTSVDGQLAADDPLRGTTAIANARMAYHRFQNAQATPEVRALAADGARAQRPLWASTSTKDPMLPDTYYVDALAGPETVNTMPEATLDAVRDHGKVEDRLTGTETDAEATLTAIASRGVDLGQVTKELETDGVEKFAASFEAAVSAVAAAIDR